jgi:hypothetical protein
MAKSSRSSSRSAALAANIAQARATNAAGLAAARASGQAATAARNAANTHAGGRTTANGVYSRNQTPTTRTGTSNSSNSYSSSSSAKNTSAAQSLVQQMLNIAGGKTIKNNLYDKDQAPEKEPMEESYDYTGSKYLTKQGALQQYLQPQTPQVVPQQTGVLAMIAELMNSQKAREASQISNIAQNYQAPKVQYYDPIQQIANIAPISSAGDNITPTLSAYATANDAAAAQQAAYNDQFNSVTAARTAEANAMNDSVNTIAGLLESLLSDENADASLGYNYDLLDYNKSQDSQTAAAQRILWGIASLADYNLLGIDPSTVPYEQLNAMVNQDNERKKTELYGLGLTV